MIKKILKILLIFVIVLSFLLSLASPSYAYVSVKGYYRKDGTYVKPHVRSNPNGLKYDNYSWTPSQGLYNDTYGTRGTYWDTPTYITDPDYYEGKSLYEQKKAETSYGSLDYNEYCKSEYGNTAYYNSSDDHCYYCPENSYRESSDKCYCNSGYIFDGVNNKCIKNEPVELGYTLGASYPEDNPLNLDVGWLIKNSKFAEVFYVNDSFCLQWIINERVAEKYFGKNWNSKGNIKEFSEIPDKYKFCDNLN